MDAYGEDFARIYDVKWSAFAKQVAPLILDFYASTPIGETNKSVLDLCCGAGHLAAHFLENDYRVVGIDRSEHMLHHAELNTRPFLETGQARFIKADARDFTLNERFGLIVSTYDSINHLKDERDLIACFQSVHAVCDGYFVFDLNTRKGLRRWNGIQVDDNPEVSLIMTRGIYDGQSARAATRITGFLADSNGLYRRFDETLYNTVFDMETVRTTLLNFGWKNVYFARVQDLSTPLAQPEDEPRVFIVAGA